MISSRGLLAAFCLVALAAPAGALPSGQSGVNAVAVPAPGSTQRRAILDALRPAIEQRLEAPVEFVVRTIRVRDGWALVIADPQRPGGGRIAPERYYSGEALEVMDGLTVNGVLRFQGGGWRLVDHAIGPTDVWYCGLDGPPAALTGC